MTMAQLADANRGLIGEVFLAPGDTERELALRYAAAAQAMSRCSARPCGTSTTSTCTSRSGRRWSPRRRSSPGQAPRSAQEVAVAFADLVGFTKLGERLEVGQIGEAHRPPHRVATSIARGRRSGW